MDRLILTVVNTEQKDWLKAKSMSCAAQVSSFGNLLSFYDIFCCLQWVLLCILFLSVVVMAIICLSDEWFLHWVFTSLYVHDFSLALPNTGLEALGVPQWLPTALNGYNGWNTGDKFSVCTVKSSLQLFSSSVQGSAIIIFHLYKEHKCSCCITRAQHELTQAAICGFA